MTTPKPEHTPKYSVKTFATNTLIKNALKPSVHIVQKNGNDFIVDAYLPLEDATLISTALNRDHLFEEMRKFIKELSLGVPENSSQWTAKDLLQKIVEAEK